MLTFRGSSKEKREDCPIPNLETETQQTVLFLSMQLLL